MWEYPYGLTVTDTQKNAALKTQHLWRNNA